MERRRWFQFRRNGIGIRLSLSLTLALLPVGLLAVFESYSSFKRNRDLEALAIYGTAQELLDRSSRRLNEAASTTRLLGTIFTAGTGGEDCSDGLSYIVDRDARIRNAALVSTSLQTICATEGFDPLRYLERSPTMDFAAARQPEVLVTNAATPAGKFESQVAFIEPISVQGDLAAWALTVWPEVYFEAARSEAAPQTAIIDSYGRAFAAASPDMVPDPYPEGVLGGRARQIFTATSAGGAQLLYAAIPIRGTGLTALAAQPGTGGTSFGVDAYVWTLLLPFLMWGISLFVAFFSTSRLATGPIRRLERMTRAMSHGKREFSGLQLSHAPTELQVLSDGFVDMAGRVARYEKNLEEALAEKTFLLREVHHRVRNNLQLLVSMLNMQERTAGSPETRKALAQFRRRVFGLAAAHEMLFGAEDLVRNITEELVTEAVKGALMVAGFGMHEPEMEISDIAVPIDGTVPFALFMSEATANAIAFGREKGFRPRLVLVLRAGRVNGRDEGHFTLENRLAGAEPDAESVAGSAGADKLGERLMQALARQLEGRCTISVTEDSYRTDLVFRIAGRSAETAAISARS